MEEDKTPGSLGKVKEAIIGIFLLSIIAAYFFATGYFYRFGINIASFLALDDLLFLFTKWIWMIYVILVFWIWWLSLNYYVGWTWRRGVYRGSTGSVPVSR